MHASTFLHKLFANTIHKSRIKLLAQVITGVINVKTLNLSLLGRGLDLAIQERSGIRKIDRLLANEYFQNHSAHIYEQIISFVVGKKTRPVIIVDWTKLPNTEHYALRAAMAAVGRSITLYEEVHPKEEACTRAVQHLFLQRFKKLLPEGCCPILVTDAGFKNPWFKAVLELGWDFIGRVRGLAHYSLEGDNFKRCTQLHHLATNSPRYIGQGILTKQNPLQVYFYTFKSKLKGRKKYTRSGRVDTHKDSKSYSRSHREPWVLVSSLKGVSVANKIIKSYKKRMAIEESFRDLKNPIYGFSLSENKTRKSARLIVWLMIAALASLLAWIMGQAAEELKLHYQFQANSYKHRRVLSLFYLGCQIIRKKIKLKLDFQNIIFDSEEIFS